MRLLIVTHCFPPDLNPRAFRWGGLVRHWGEQGHEIDVVCGPGLSAPMPGNVRVNSVGSRPSAVLRSRLPSPAATSGNSATASRSSQSRLAVRVMKRLRDLTWKKVYWPDYACLWYFAAKQKVGMLLDERTYDVVVTVSNPYTCHLLGSVVRRHRPQQRWVVDIGDAFSMAPESPVNNLWLYERRNRELEHRVLAAADVVTVTNVPMAEDYAAAFPEFAGKFRIVPPLLSPENSAGEEPSPFALDGRRRMVFAGRLYRDLRSPAALLTVFRRLIERSEHSTLDLHFFGAHDDCGEQFDAIRSLVGQRVFLHGVVPRATALAALSHADVLVNLGNTTRHQLPSKLVEYMSTGRPIVNFVTRADDGSARFLADYPGLMNVSEASLDSADCVEQLSNFIARPRPRIADDVIERLITPYSLPAIAEDYEAVFREALAADAAGAS
jgi:glycosyltransferase involved in cell wall biosynthesis